jgi:hypothetical protein
LGAGIAFLRAETAWRRERILGSEICNMHIPGDMAMGKKSVT